jgi:hypothetical protein
MQNTGLLSGSIEELKERRREIRVALGHGIVTDPETRVKLAANEEKLTAEIARLESKE